MSFPLFDLLYKKASTIESLTDQEKLSFIQYVNRCNKDEMRNVFKIIKYYGLLHEYSGNPFADQYDSIRKEKSKQTSDYYFDFNKLPEKLQKMLIVLSKQEQEA